MSSLPHFPAGAAPESLADILFARVPAEDAGRYVPGTLDRLAQESAARFVRHAPGTTDIRVIDAEDGLAGPFTIVEIVNDDMPFLLDSTLAELGEHGLDLHLVAHPMVVAERDGAGALTRFLGLAGGREAAPARRESIIHIHVARIADAAARERLTQGLAQVFDAVRAAVAGWQGMRARLSDVVSRYRAFPPLLPADEVAEAVQFMDWLLADNFTFLGMREYRFPDAELSGEPEPGEGLGILRDPNVKVLRRGSELVVMSPEVRAFLKEPQPLIIAKANVKSRVHRRVHMDYIGVKLMDAAGRFEGELRIVGLFTSTAYTVSTRAIPYIRHKVAGVFARAGFDAAGHSGKALLNVLESYPRDELFQLDADTLYGFALDVLALVERPRIRVLARADRFDRFVSVMVFVPKDRYDTTVRRRIGAYLAEVFRGKLSAAYPTYPEGPLARTHFIIGRYEGATPAIPREDLEAAVQVIVRTWADGLKDALAVARPGEAARQYARYGEAFNAAYREAFLPEEALADIAVLDGLSEAAHFAVDVYRKRGEGEGRASLKVFSRGRPIPLSTRVPMLENLGFTVINERTYRIAPASADEAHNVWLHDMTLERARGGPIDVEALDPAIEATIMAVLEGGLESDRFNALVVEAGLSPAAANILRCYGRYLRQIGVPYTQDYLADVLAKYPDIAGDLVALFAAKFDPDRSGAADRPGMIEPLRTKVLAAVDTIQSLDEDRILRRMLNLIDATLRTNAYQRTEGGAPRPTIALKFSPRHIDGMPLPKPLFEIFVFGPQVEGVHLRFGKVARGGLRWSDRPMDYRTEVLGLVKAQQVKNAVIVPVGAKGGFFPKRLPAAGQREAWLAEGTSAYKVFVSALLDVTDTIGPEGLIPPPRTLRFDEDDPYLVVAADKGTATFSDTANAISVERGHWLGDAFASGGSAGYDHKVMGITARGGWEAVKRHFREIDIDIQKTPFTVAGVGDMSGDVFGNGMLLSPAIRLVAAFDHRDIFIDPNPDPAVGLAERQRLFKLPRSSWQDYDKSLISAGGGVFSRAAKQIALSPEACAVLGIGAESATPAEVMQAILRAPVDLLWFGGIGTYIRATDEADAEVGDRANDLLRIAATELRAKVIGEGANLGVTQRGRIEAARAGVRLNTDAIDNSAGVNSSDVEVNLKIALATPERDGRLTRADRNALLSAMTDDVARLVLRNNYLQSLALSLAEKEGAAGIGPARRLMRTLEQRGLLDRAVEFLPSDAELSRRERAGEGLTRPELAVLLAYAKITFYDDLLAGSAPDDPQLLGELQRYFPPALLERFPDAVEGHRLRREIIATQIANALINRCGPASVVSIGERTGATPDTIARAYFLTREAFGLLDLNVALDRHDARIPGALQLELYRRVQAAVFGGVSWFVANGLADRPLEETVTRFKSGIAAVMAGDGGALAGPEAAQAAELVAAGLEAETAAQLARLPRLVEAPEVVLMAEGAGVDIAEAGGVIAELNDVLGLDRVGRMAAQVVASEDTERQAVARLAEAYAKARRRLAIAVLETPGGLTSWASGRERRLDRAEKAMADLVAGTPSLARLALAEGIVEDLLDTDE